VPEGPRSQFVRNQILYFLGRLDASDETKQFLAAVWHSDQPPFIRYSAAFTGAMIGAPTIEEEYYARLVDDCESDALNRGYHLFYHGDQDLREEDMPWHDDGAVPATRTIEVLIFRLRATGLANRRLRRLELHTLRRFAETRGGSQTS
jgi:hypothetical protein